jgi:hypothetical protein
MTDARLGGIAREALVTSTGQAKLAGIVREALLAGVGLAGRIGAQSSAQGSVTTTFTGVVFLGRITTTARAKVSASLTLNLAGRIKTTSTGQSFFLQGVTVAGRIKTMATARMLRVGQVAVAGKVTSQAKARGLVNLQTSALRLQYGVTINTG